VDQKRTIALYTFVIDKENDNYTQVYVSGYDANQTFVITAYSGTDDSLDPLITGNKTLTIKKTFYDTVCPPGQWAFLSDRYCHVRVSVEVKGNEFNVTYFMVTLVKGFNTMQLNEGL
jgi:hypothetical protein